MSPILPYETRSTVPFVLMTDNALQMAQECDALLSDVRNVEKRDEVAKTMKWESADALETFLLHGANAKPH